MATKKAGEKETRSGAGKNVLLIIGVVGAILVLALCGCCAFTGMLGGSGDEDTKESSEVKGEVEDISGTEEAEEAEEETKVEEEIRDSNIEEEDVKRTIELDDFNKKTLSTLKEKYGEPNGDWNDINELPLFSHAEWDTDEYNILIDYKKGEELSYGGLFTLKELKCSQSDLSLEHVEKAMKSVGLEYKSKSDWLKNEGTLKSQFYSDGYIGWESIVVKCNEDGQVYINAGAEGYMDWSME